MLLLPLSINFRTYRGAGRFLDVFLLRKPGYPQALLPKGVHQLLRHVLSPSPSSFRLYCHSPHRCLSFSSFSAVLVPLSRDFPLTKICPIPLSPVLGGAIPLALEYGDPALAKFALSRSLPPGAAILPLPPATLFFSRQTSKKCKS